MLRDTETELMFKQMSRPLISAAGLDPNSVKVDLLNDPEINAFVATGQTVYIQSGLLEATDNVNQLQGVVAHELGHVIAGDAIRSGEGANRRSESAYFARACSTAIAAGGRIWQGIMRPANGCLGNSWPSLGARKRRPTHRARLLSKAGISGKGMLDFFRNCRITNIASQSIRRTVSAGTTRSPERIQALRQTLRSDPAWGNRAILSSRRGSAGQSQALGYIDPKQAVIKYPESDQSIPAHFARAYAYHLGGYPDKAIAEADALLAKDPHDPFFLELKGQILLEGGKPQEAIPVLREAVQRSGEAPMIAAMLGHALVATEDPKNFAEAKQILKVAVNRDNEDPFAWYQLGIIYDRKGDQSRAMLATAERSNLRATRRWPMRVRRWR